MKSPILGLCMAALVLLSTTTASAHDCKGLKALQSKHDRSTSIGKQILDLFLGNNKARTDCGSLTSVVDSVTNRRQIGGRKLEEARPFDLNAARANLKEALDDPAIRQRLAQIKKDIPDATQRLFYEAAILDEEGYYSARDMYIRQLQQQLK